MSIPEIEFPLYLRHPEWRGDRSKAPAARTVETTATVLFDLDVHGRVIGVEILGEVPTRTEWAVGNDKLWNCFEDEEGARDYQEEQTELLEVPPKLGRRQVTRIEWVEVDEKETGNA